MKHNTQEAIEHSCSADTTDSMHDLMFVFELMAQ